MRDYQAKWRRKRRDEWLKENGPCRHCGSWERLEVDHVDPSEKVTHQIWSWTRARREEELKKCQPLCHACHKLKTAEFLSERHKGRSASAKKLTSQQALEIYRLAKDGIGAREIGRRYGIHHSTVIRIREGKYWAITVAKSKPTQLSLFGGAA